MSRANLYLSPRAPFTGVSAQYERSDYVFFGVPYDRTSTYRSGSRFAPSAIRDVSANLELYSIRNDLDLEGVPVHDMGDVDVVDDLEHTLQRVSSVVSEISASGRIPMMTGGEHSITKGAVEAFPRDIGVLSFDAHMDLRDEFLGEKLSHATFMRRLADRLGSEHVMEVGIRAFSKPELDFCRQSGLKTISPLEIREKGTQPIAKAIGSFLNRFPRTYVTVDIDVLDPAFAPGVGNPEPDGLSTDELLTLVNSSMTQSLVCFDLVEVSPQIDSGQTAAVGAKVILEAIGAHRSRKKIGSSR